MGRGGDGGLWTIPNMITLGRIAFCPALAGLIATGHYELALAGLAGTSFTDWLDGYLARKLNQKTVVGGFLDPLADKVMVTTVSLGLAYQGLIPAYLVVVMVGRDALLVGGSLLHRYRTRRPADAFFDAETLDYKITPSTLSKLNTGLQFLTLWLGLTNAVYGLPGDTALGGLCLVTATATVASGTNYLLSTSGMTPNATRLGRLGRRLRERKERMEARLLDREGRLRDGIRRRSEIVREGLLDREGRLRDGIRRRREIVREGLTRRRELVRHQVVHGRSRVRKHTQAVRERVLRVKRPPSPPPPQP